MKNWLRNLLSAGKNKFELSFCESSLATSISKWHIRELTREGRKPGGGADSTALCGRKVDWDLNVKLTEFHLENNTCSKCQNEFKLKMNVK
jgi:hypothetical protein